MPFEILNEDQIDSIGIDLTVVDLVFNIKNRRLLSVALNNGVAKIFKLNNNLC